MSKFSQPLISWVSDRLLKVLEGKKTYIVGWLILAFNSLAVLNVLPEEIKLEIANLVFGFLVLIARSLVKR